MHTELRHNPDFGIVRVTFQQPGEQIITESGAMVARDSAVDMKTNMQGGLGGALKRKLLGGESLFQNTFTATAPGQTVWIAPAAEGTVECIDLQPGMELFLQSGAYLASTSGVVLDTKWQGAKGFFSGGLFLLRAYGQGQIWFSSYGGLHAVDIGVQYPGYICDNSHMVAFTIGLQYQVKKLGGLKSLFFSGEGLVCEFAGQGRLWMQTRNPSSLATFLHPFRRVASSSSS
jgi:uncharacterized protein (TIGR00266 family)